MNPRNVVLIVLDTVRKDYFDKYAHRIQSRSDVSIKNGRAASSWSVPSHASILTGELPHVHGIHTHNRHFDSLTREETFLSSLPDHTTLGASANVFASATFGFDSVFDDYSDIAQHRRFPQGMDMERFIQTRERKGIFRFWEFLNAAKRHDHPLQSLANGASFKIDDLMLKLPFPKLTDDGAKLVKREGLRKVKANSEPFFLFTNFMDAHAPLQHILGFDKSIHSASYSWSSRDFEQWQVILEGIDESNKRDVQNHRELYSCAIDYLDRQVAAFIDDVQKNTDRETTFVITADHGENLGFEGDNGLFGHTNSLTEALLHVPFEVINPPGDIEQQISEYVTHLDLGQLIVNLAGGNFDVPTNESIPAEVIGSGVGDPPNDNTEYWDRMIRCAYQGEEKVEWDSQDGSYRYLLNSDQPCWQELDEENISIPAWASEHFEGNVEELKKKAMTQKSSREIDATTEERLKELGYM